MDATVKTLNSFLLSQHIHVPQDWLKACIEWLCQENQGIRGQIHSLKEQVRDQWLMTNLTELAVARIPQRVHDEKYTLNGIYCLQINSIIDVSTPLYGQMLKVQNRDNANSKVTAETQITQKPWEKNGTRMLMMELTDGVTKVSGMEYRGIPALKDTLIPGTKIRIKGPVLCRNGVLMLSSTNVQLLGGEVEELKLTHSKTAILCATFNQPLVVQNENQENAPPTLPLNTLDAISDSGYHTQQSNLPRQSVQQNVAEDSFLMDLDEEDLISEMERIESQKSMTNSASSNITTQLQQKQSTPPLNAKHVKSISTLGGKKSLTKASSISGNSNSRQLSIENAFKQNFKEPSGKYSCLQAPKNKITRTETALHYENNPSAASSQITVNVKSCDFDPFATKKSVNKAINITTPFNSTDMDKTCPSLLSRLGKSQRHESPATNEKSKPILSSVKHESFDRDQDTQNQERSSTVKYLCQLQSIPKYQEVVHITVKAYIVTLLSKLQCNVSEGGWGLKAKICDGTAVLDVAFSNQVLAELIGFQAQEAEEIKRNRESLLGERLRLGMANCRNSIITMCKMMKIQFGNSMPRVFQLFDANDSYWAEMRIA